MLVNKIMQVLKNLFGENKKISASEIAIKDSEEKAITIDSLLKRTILYDNSSGTKTNFTLKDSASNYKFIEIYYGYGKINNFGNNSVKIYYKYQNSANLILAIYDGQSAQQMMTTIDINEKQVSIRKSGLVDLITHDKYTSNFIYVYLVVGYK